MIERYDTSKTGWAILRRQINTMPDRENGHWIVESISNSWVGHEGCWQRSGSARDGECKIEVFIGGPAEVSICRIDGRGFAFIIDGYKIINVGMEGIAEAVGAAIAEMNAAESYHLPEGS